MPQQTERELVETFYRAVCAQDYDVIESFLADDAVWSIGGPVDALPYCGTYRGRARIRQVLDHKIAETLGRRKIIADSFVADRGRGALLGRLVAHLTDGQTIAYRVALFFAMCDGKVHEVHVLLDSFDAAEQVIGRRLDFSHDDGEWPHDSIVPV
jgi:ketosteroid isomerase-like protein